MKNIYKLFSHYCVILLSLIGLFFGNSHLFSNSINDAMTYFEEYNYFPDEGLKQGVKNALENKDWVFLENNRGSLNIFDYSLSNISLLEVENASSLNGIEKIYNLVELDLEKSSVTDLSPLNGTSIYRLEYDESELTTIDLTVLTEMPNLTALLLHENNFTQIPNIPDSLDLHYFDINQNFLDLGDQTTLDKIKLLQERDIFVYYDNQFPNFLINLQDRVNGGPQFATTKGNFLYGFEILLSLFEEESFKDLVLASGLVHNSFSNFTLADLHAEAAQKYEDENESIDPSMDMERLENFFSNQLKDRMQLAIEYLQTAAGDDQQFTIDQKYSGTEDEIIVDQADMYIATAIAQTLYGFGAFISAYNWEQNAKDLESLDDADQINAETLLRGRKLLSMQRTSHMLEARTSFINAIESYNSARADIRDTGRMSLPRLFNMDENELANEEEFFAELEKYKSEVSKTSHKIDVENFDDFVGDKAIVNPDAFFSGKFDPINQMPRSEAGFLNILGNDFISDKVDDPTFGGVFPNWTQDYFTQKMLDWGILDTNASPMNSTKKFLNSDNWKSSGWLGYFYRPSNQPSFKDENNQSIVSDESRFLAYHQYLGWIWVDARSNSEVWIYRFADDKSGGYWLWTKPTLFPYIYLLEEERWNYMMPGGQLLQWDPDQKSWK